MVVPFQLAFEHCNFAIVCLFAAFIIGSFPGIVDNVKGQKVRPICIVVLSLAFLLAAAIGVVSVIVGFGQKIDNLFAETPFYLYLILFGLGIVCASGLTVPGFSASLLLLVVGFYDPILNLVHIEEIQNNPGRFFGILGSFGAGVIVGFFLFSFLMSFLLKKHTQSTHYAIIGFIGGSLVAIFVNSRMFDYINKHGGLQLLDWILAPIFIIVGIVLAYLLVHYSRKSKPEEEEIENA